MNFAGLTGTFSREALSQKAKQMRAAVETSAPPPIASSSRSCGSRRPPEAAIQVTNSEHIPFASIHTTRYATLILRAIRNNSMIDTIHVREGESN